ncbi:glucose 1-dehydrogenase [Nocardia sp. NBC_01503]|uniref:SDR family NAD(P)-dependent oxidoreductase n=1 Tax=Nocardia sp. NBC_01503 TaxID=2975997 RepID=UPI002E7AB795|nr:glucose 1-dehydrogenase [Nocardia sp. NBC_01503]WTL35442.1 glucose 1-dehydrogenase [Nocardia sp. NBC_01503]
MQDNGSRFDDKIALITGGSSGMGLATARRLLDEGASVVITGRDRARLDAAVKELDGGDRVLAVAGDAAHLADLDALVAAIENRFGRLDVVFANAGIGAFQAFTDVTEAEYHRVLDINFKSVFFTIQKTLPLVRDHGAIVINASFALHRGSPGAALYSATKAAVHNLARTLAAELAPRGIRVNSVSPGYTSTPAFHAETSPEIRAAAAASTLASRVGSAEEVAAAVAFLTSGEAGYINAQDLLVDGGMTTATPAQQV